MNLMAEKLRRGGVAVRSSDFRLYRRLVRKTKKYIPLFTACTLVNGFAMFLIFSSVGVLLQNIFSYATGDGDIVEAGEVGLYLLAICAFAFAGAFATTGFTYIEEKSRILIRRKMMNSYFKSDEIAVAELSSGEVLNRINIDLNAGLNLIGNYMSSWIFQPMVSCVISVGFLITVNWMIALLCVFCGILNMAVLKMSAEKIIQEATEGSIVQYADAVRLDRSLLRRRPSELSGGEKQRVAIARALAAKPDILLADEPISAMDASAKAGMLNLFMDIRDEFGITMLLVEHDMKAAQCVSDRMLIMENGRIEAI